MNKAEELKQNLDVLYSGERTPWKEREILNQLEQYAQQSREEDIKSFLDFVYDQDHETIAHTMINFEPAYNAWNHQNQEDEM